MAKTLPHTEMPSWHVVPTVCQFSEKEKHPRKKIIFVINLGCGDLNIEVDIIARYTVITMYNNCLPIHRQMNQKGLM